MSPGHSPYSLQPPTHIVYRLNFFFVFLSKHRYAAIILCFYRKKKQQHSITIRKSKIIHHDNNVLAVLRGNHLIKEHGSKVGSLLHWRQRKQHKQNHTKLHFTQRNQRSNWPGWQVVLFTRLNSTWIDPRQNIDQDRVTSFSSFTCTLKLRFWSDWGIRSLFCFSNVAETIGFEIFPWFLNWESQRKVTHEPSLARMRRWYASRFGHFQAWVTGFSWMQKPWV